MRAPFNVATRKVGGIRFLKIGRLTLSCCLSREFRPFPAPSPLAGRRVFVPAEVPAIALPLAARPLDRNPFSLAPPPSPRPSLGLVALLVLAGVAPALPLVALALRY